MLDQAVGVLTHRVRLDEPMILEFGLVVALQHHILLQRKVQHQAMLVPVLRDVGHLLAALSYLRVGNIVPAQLHGAAAGLLQAGQAVYQLGLAVAINARDTQDLPAARGKGHIVHGVLLVQLAGHGKVLYLQHRLAGLRRGFLHLQLDRAAHHHIAQLLLVGLGRIDGADIFALAQYGAAVRHRHDLIEFMTDKEDALALLGQVAHDLHQLIDLLRGQYGGRLIKDKDLIIAVQHLQDLHPLLHTDGDILHLGVHVNGKPVFFRELLHLLPGFFLLQKAQLGVLRPQDDVIQHGKNINELEVLVHHADAQCRGVIGVIDLYRHAVFADLSFFRLVQAKEHAHQRTFARTVFAQQRVDLPAPQLQGNIVICLNAGELLGDVKHFNNVIIVVVLFHAPSPLPVCLVWSVPPCAHCILQHYNYIVSPGKLQGRPCPPA